MLREGMRSIVRARRLAQVCCPSGFASQGPAVPLTEYSAPGALRVSWKSSSAWPRVAA